MSNAESDQVDPQEVLIDAIAAYDDAAYTANDGTIEDALQSVIVAALRAASLEELTNEIEARREQMLAELGTDQEAALIAALAEAR